MFWKNIHPGGVKDGYRRATERFDSEAHRIEKEVARVEKSMNDEPSDKKEINARVEYLLYRAKMLDAEMNAFYTKFFTCSR